MAEDDGGRIVVFGVFPHRAEVEHDRFDRNGRRSDVEVFDDAVDRMARIVFETERFADRIADAQCFYCRLIDQYVVFRVPFRQLAFQELQTVKLEIAVAARDRLDRDAFRRSRLAFPLRKVAVKTGMAGE